MDEPHIDRRTMFKFGAVALAGTAGVTGTTTAVPNPFAPTRLGAGGLPRAQVSPDRIIRQVAGLRPYRPSGFVVRAEAMGGKTIIHNYGHGGAGITLSWGAADLAATLALQTTGRQAAVLGCGAVGLATARTLQDRGFDVTIYAQGVPPNTTSNVAAAMWSPVSLADEARITPEFRAQLEQACRFSYRYFQPMVGERYGVRWLDTYLIGDEPQSLPPQFTVVADLFPLTALASDENPFPTKYASRFHDMQIQTNVYLPAVLSDFLARGGKLVVQEFAELGAVLALPEPVILNCTGLGAAALFGDKELVPLKGQLVVLLPQPEINYAWVDGAQSLYMFPRPDGIFLGETQQMGVSSLEPDETEAARILNGVQQIYAQMR